MTPNLSAAATFDRLLRQDRRAAQFYAACTPTQRNAILCQLSRLESQAQVQAFVEHLPSAAL